MLGRGRPFVVEIKRPRVRSLDLLKIQEEINEREKGKIKVNGLTFVKKEMVRKIKNLETAKKTYKVIVKFNRDVSEEEISNLENIFTQVTVFQKTPSRVLHRRSDLTREKQIYETRIKSLSPKHIEMRIECQGGLYIKELVTGDNERTNPNVSKIVGAKAEPLELDVLNVFTKDGKK
jgi:tRNA pseudouridine synthase 10